MSAEFVLVNAPLTALFITRGLGSAGCHAESAIVYRSVTRYINVKFAADQPDLSNGPEEAQNMP